MSVVCHLTAPRSTLVAAAFLAMILLPAANVPADVVVLANRTRGRVALEVQPGTGRVEQLTLGAGDVVPYFSDGRVRVQFASSDKVVGYLLDANSAYFFGLAREGRIDLQKIGLGDDKSTARGRKLPGTALSAPSATIPVKILVDEEEPRRQSLWEQRLRKRINLASAILDQYAKVQLKVVAVESWSSDNATTDFVKSLAEFEREVNPFPARLAIGFTSQYEFRRGRQHLGGTRGPLNTHVLVRESAPKVSESERLELLVHEMGHYLGASHSPEPGSVMRPVLGNRKAGQGPFWIRFDPVNTLAIAMVGEEVRRRRVESFSDLTPGTKRRLRQVYTELSRAFPKDAAAKQFVMTVDAATTVPIVDGTKEVLSELVRAARANRSRLPAEDTPSTARSRRTGDALTEYYVRQAARAAQSLPNDVGPTALLLALGIGLDDSDTLRNLPTTKSLVRAVESTAQRTIRLAVLGEPTMGGRRDLAKHFFVSAYLTVSLGTEAAQSAGLAKELLDAHGASGFSFADMAADRAGMLFAGAVSRRRFSLPKLAETFSVDTFMPSVAGLAEGLTAAELEARFGPPTDRRFQEQLRHVDRRVLQLPAYRQPGAL